MAQAGGCLCGKLRYEVTTDPLWVTICFCSFCQRATGGAYMVEPVFNKADLSVVAGAPAQDATCYGYYNYPGSLDTVDMFEEQLVSLGSHRVTRRPDGTLARADLKEAQDIGQRGYGMWADPRIAE